MLAPRCARSARSSALTLASPASFLTMSLAVGCAVVVVAVVVEVTGPVAAMLSAPTLRRRVRRRRSTRRRACRRFLGTASHRCLFTSAVPRARTEGQWSPSVVFEVFSKNKGETKGGGG